MVGNLRAGNYRRGEAAAVSSTVTLIYLSGPVIVTVLAAAISPTTGLLVILAFMPLLLANSLWLMGVLALVAGVAITPMLISLYSLLSNLVHKSLATEGFAWIASLITVGSSAGTAASGLLVDRAGSPAPSHSFRGAACSPH